MVVEGALLAAGTGWRGAGAFVCWGGTPVGRALGMLPAASSG
jgi:hypothetical protein